MTGVVGINIFSILIDCQGLFMRPSNIAFVNSFNSVPFASFGIRHGNLAMVFAAPRTIHHASATATAVRLAVGRRFRFLKETVNVISRNTTAATFTAGESSHTTPGINDDCLALGRCSAPQINVVGSVTLIQGADLLGFITTPEATRWRGGWDKVASRFLDMTRDQRIRNQRNSTRSQRRHQDSRQWGTARKFHGKHFRGTRK